jgi:transposase
MAKHSDKTVNHAQLLYVRENLSPAEVAERISIPLRTVQSWVSKYKWDELKTTLIMTKEQELRRLYAQLKEINDAIEAKPEGTRYADSKTADVLSKTAATIKQLETETTVASIIDVAQAFIKWVRQFDIDKSKELTPLFDGFIKDKLK